MITGGSGCGGVGGGTAHISFLVTSLVHFFTCTKLLGAHSLALWFIGVGSGAVRAVRTRSAIRKAQPHVGGR